MIIRQITSCCINLIIKSKTIVEYQILQYDMFRIESVISIKHTIMYWEVCNMKYIYKTNFRVFENIQQTLPFLTSLFFYCRE